MHRKTRLICIAAGFAVAGAAATADAAKPLTPKERQARAAEFKQAHGSFQPPRTMAQAEAHIAPLPGGGEAAALPTELWSHLSVQRDGSGAVQVRETEGNTVSTTPAEGRDHE